MVWGQPVFEEVCWDKKLAGLQFQFHFPTDNRDLYKLIEPMNLNELIVYKPLFVCVFSAPPTFESIMEDLDVSVGETPRFAVVVEGRPIPDILWYKVCLSVCISS